MRTLLTLALLALPNLALGDLTVTFDATGMTNGDLHFGILYGINVEGDENEFVEAFELELLDTSKYVWQFGFSSDLENDLGNILARNEFADVLSANGNPYREVLSGIGDLADQVSLNLLSPGIPAGREVRFDIEDGGILKGGDFAGLLQVTATSNRGYTDTAVLEFVSPEQSIAVLHLGPPIPEPSTLLLTLIAAGLVLVHRRGRQATRRR